MSFLFCKCSTGGPGAHSAGWWLSLLHLINNFPGPQLIRAPRPLRPNVAFLNLVCNSVRSLTATLWLLPWLSYIIVQRPLSRLLDLWNRMFDRHQAEITVMQFTDSGASVYECTMGIFFTSSQFVSQFPPSRFPLITAIRMCHLLPVHHLGMAFFAGSKVKIQQTFLSLNRSSRPHPVSAQSWCIYLPPPMDEQDETQDQF